MAAGSTSPARARRTADTGWRYRLAVVSRVLAGVGMGYVLSALSATAMALWLPLHRAEAVITGTLASYVLLACAVMWAFAARTAWWAWGVLAAPSALLAALLWGAQRAGGVA